jgi:RNA polymerase sigma-70 factor (ECF subfamily)
MTEAMLSDEDLMGEVARGSEDALRELLRRYERPLAGYLRRQTGDRDAEDLFQDVWLRVVRSARSFDRTARFKPWLYRIAFNVFRDWWRGSGARETVAEIDAVAEPGAREGAALDAERLLARLPREQRDVVALRYWLDLSEAEMSEVLDIPRGTVKSRLHAAMSKLSALAREKGRDS